MPPRGATPIAHDALAAFTASDACREMLVFLEESHVPLTNYYLRIFEEHYVFFEEHI